MKRLLLSISLILLCPCMKAQWRDTPGNTGGYRTLRDYIGAAKKNSPAIKDLRYSTEIQEVEFQRLKAMYTRSHLEMSGEWLFVPIISLDSGHTAFEWNAQEGGDYFGYDLGENSGHLHAGLNWTQPLLGGASYRAAKERNSIEQQRAAQNIRMEEHQLERAVTEQYLLCRLDRIRIAYADSLSRILDRQAETIKKLASNGMARLSDVNLLNIEKLSNAEARTAAESSLRTHVLDLNILCGIEEDEAADNGLDFPSDGILPDTLHSPDGGRSIFTETFILDSLSAENSLRSFNLQYRPQLNLFASTGLQAGSFDSWYRHFGVSAGISLTWTIFDGGQKRMKARQTELEKRSIDIYMRNAELRRELKLRECRSEIAACGEREKSLKSKIAEYENVLSSYSRQMSEGQISVLEYITVLRNKIRTEQDLQLLVTNREMAVAAFNYWNR